MTTRACVALTEHLSPEDAGRDLAEQIRGTLGEGPPDAVLLFATPELESAPLLASLHAHAAPRTLVGGVALGGFVRSGYVERCAIAVAFRSTDLRFRATSVSGLGGDPLGAARELVSTFGGARGHQDTHRSAIVLIDPRMAFADDFLQELIAQTAGKYQLFGGGVADDMQIHGSHLFFGERVLEDAVVALEILSPRPIGVTVLHGWRPNSEGMRVTEVDGTRVVSLNAIPATEIFEQHAQRTRQTFDRSNPAPFFLQNILGVDVGQGMNFRVPIAIHDDGSIAFATEVPLDATVHIMHTTELLALEGALGAAREARARLGPEGASVAIFFDCLASRARMQLGFGFDPKLLAGALGTASYAGFATCGQIVRSDGQFDGFQNCTSVLCLFPA